jgi:hypothetical protein
LDFENALDYISIRIKTEKSFIPKNEGWNNDNRRLGVMITKWSLSKVSIELPKIDDDIFN